jgi:hypothetical protein
VFLLSSITYFKKKIPSQNGNFFSILRREKFSLLGKQFELQENLYSKMFDNFFFPKLLELLQSEDLLMPLMHSVLVQGRVGGDPGHHSGQIQDHHRGYYSP